MGLIKEINRAAILCTKHREASEKVNQLFEQRYGKGFSDSDCNPLIDEIDVQGGGGTWKTLKELDQMVLEYCGLRPRKEAP